MKDLFVLSVAGGGGTLTFAKALQKPEPAMAVNIEQNAKRMAVTSDEYDYNLVFEKSENGLTCISGCNAPITHWKAISTAKEVRSDPGEKIDFDALPATNLGNIDGAWIQSNSDSDGIEDIAYEVKGEFVKRYDFTFGLYPNSRTPDIFMVKGESFIEPGSGGKVLQLRKLSDTKLVARSPQRKGLVYLYRAESIKFSDLKKARDAAES
ncbi:hypothetical protein D3C78_1330430 [compost metagenome]